MLNSEISNIKMQMNEIARRSLSGGQAILDHYGQFIVANGHNILLTYQQFLKQEKLEDNEISKREFVTFSMENMERLTAQAQNELVKKLEEDNRNEFNIYSQWLKSQGLVDSLKGRIAFKNECLSNLYESCQDIELQQKIASMYLNFGQKSGKFVADDLKDLQKQISDKGKFSNRVVNTEFGARAVSGSLGFFGTIGGLGLGVIPGTYIAVNEIIKTSESIDLTNIIAGLNTLSTSIQNASKFSTHNSGLSDYIEAVNSIQSVITDAGLFASSIDKFKQALYIPDFTFSAELYKDLLPATLFGLGALSSTFLAPLGLSAISYYNQHSLRTALNKRFEELENSTTLAIHAGKNIPTTEYLASQNHGEVIAMLIEHYAKLTEKRDMLLKDPELKKFFDNMHDVKLMATTKRITSTPEKSLTDLGFDKLGKFYTLCHDVENTEKLIASLIKINQIPYSNTEKLNSELISEFNAGKDSQLAKPLQASAEKVASNTYCFLSDQIQDLASKLKIQNIGGNTFTLNKKDVEKAMQKGIEASQNCEDSLNNSGQNEITLQKQAKEWLKTMHKSYNNPLFSTRRSPSPSPAFSRKSFAVQDLHIIIKDIETNIRSLTADITQRRQPIEMYSITSDINTESISSRKDVQDKTKLAELLKTICQEVDSDVRKDKNLTYDLKKGFINGYLNAGKDLYNFLSKNPNALNKEQKLAIDLAMEVLDNAFIGREQGVAYKTITDNFDEKTADVIRQYNLQSPNINFAKSILSPEKHIDYYEKLLKDLSKEDKITFRF